MALRHRLIRVSPATVWTVLSDGGKYAEWVVGTASSRPLRGQWPAVGAAIEYEVRLGPIRATNETVVRRCEEGTVLELEAKAGPLGTARIAIDVRPWGEDTLVKVDEHPLHGAAGALHNTGVEALIQLRHRAMLARLARVCEAEAGRQESGREARAGKGASRGEGGGEAYA
ncbi:SRPBCC family protein [Streptomyces sp. NPDC058284]|uniref:SRPBCC family protein n=1 Tax=unclassified Streptomyces TaxID=2593676 RepID=UPI0036524877